jgi:outer membrane immunogenic protein
VPWLDTVRGRAGIAIDRSLVYATGGLAFADIVDSAVGQGVPGVLQSANSAGWAVGGGVEYLWSARLSVKFEFLYVDFGTHADNFAAQNNLYVSVNTHLTEEVIKLGVNYRFW